MKFNVVLALAVFHHFIKSEGTFRQLKNVLTNLHVEEMYFEPHNPLEPQMQNAYWNPSPGEFVAFILEHSELNQAMCLGRGKNGRLLFQLSL